MKQKLPTNFKEFGLWIKSLPKKYLWANIYIIGFGIGVVFLLPSLIFVAKSLAVVGGWLWKIIPFGVSIP